ncbi:MAG: J domain-containing protein [Rhodobacteraceae bacterium]|nr:MAG: J domain-containing protein [Paracoccaceae bacterium]
MPPRSPLEYDVSVTADKARRARRRGMNGATGAGDRLCEHPQCDRPGVYRAPRGPGEANGFRWFCLDHVRDYNARWNFFADFDDHAFEAFMEGQRVWERPTWRLGKPPPGVGGPHADGRAWERFGFSDPLEVLGENATLNPGRGAERAARRPSLPRNVVSALEVLGAAETETRSEIRRRYRALVKDLHPDMNGGDRSEEGRLRRVLWAWEQVKAARCIRD